MLLGQNAPSNRINIGAIGAGRISRIHDMKEIHKHADAQIVAVCDRAYVMREKVKKRYTGRDEEPDERLMRSVEEKIDIPESRKDDFRREIMNYIGALAIEAALERERLPRRQHRDRERTNHRAETGRGGGGNRRRRRGRPARPARPPPRR